MRMRAKTLSALATLALLSGCEYESVGYYPDSEMTIGKDIAIESEDIGADDASGPADDASGADDDTASGTEETLLTGPACAEDGDCESGTCITTTLLEGLGLSGVEIPGGFCSTLFCEEGDCGPQASCIDGTPFGAPDYKLCLPTCTGLIDCRWQESWGCVALIAEDPTSQVCLPDNLIVALQCEQDPECEEVTP